MKSETRTAVPWLNSVQAAVHLGFVHSDGSANLTAFKSFCARYKPRTHYLGSLRRYRLTDLDAMVEAAHQAEPLRAVAGGKR